MNSDNLFKKYLDTWPEAFIMWPTKGQAKTRDFFKPDDGDQYSTHYLFDDLLEYIKEECLSQKTLSDLSCSEWLIIYFKTPRGEDMANTHLQKHERILAEVAFNTPPLKGLFDGFILWFIDTEVRPCLI